MSNNHKSGIGYKTEPSRRGMLFNKYQEDSYTCNTTWYYSSLYIPTYIYFGLRNIWQSAVSSIFWIMRETKGKRGSTRGKIAENNVVIWIAWKECESLTLYLLHIYGFIKTKLIECWCCGKRKLTKCIGNPVGVLQALNICTFQSKVTRRGWITYVVEFCPVEWWRGYVSYMQQLIIWNNSG